MIDIFGDGKPNNEVDWTESVFSPDFLSMRDNKYDTIMPDDDYAEYSNPETRRRKKTRAVELFTHLDYQDPGTTSNGNLISWAVRHGTNRRLTKKYNSATTAERNRLRGELGNALNWMDNASLDQRKAQTAAVKKSEQYDVMGNHYGYLDAFPYDPQNPPYKEGEGLIGLEDYNFFGAGPNAKQKVIDDLNARITPWPSSRRRCRKSVS